MWIACRPPEDGGLGQRWGDVIRMGPEQLLFLLQSRQQAESAARRRLAAASGKSPSELMDEVRKREAERRFYYTGKRTLREIEEDW